MSEAAPRPRAARPRWMTAMAALSGLGALFLIYRDFAIPAVRDVEVWFGVELRRRAARLTAPLHWAVLVGGAWAYWTQQRWIALATAIYLGYVALSHVLWSALHPRAEYAPQSLGLALLSLVAAVAFVRAHRAAAAR